VLSKRLSWSVARNPLTRLLDEKRRAGAPVVDLTESNPTRAGFDYPEAEILQGLASRASLVYEPAPLGLPAAREAVSRYYGRRHLTVSPEGILLTASTSEAYSFLFKLLCDPGDSVLVPRPSYPLFDYLAALEGVEVIPYPLHYDGVWHIDLGALGGSIRPGARALLLVNPNNPTGSFVKRDELGRLLELCGTHRLALIVDEVFSDYALADDADRVDSFAEGVEGALSFVLSGLSKIVGLPQMKLAWIVVGGPAPARQAYQGLEQIADNFLSVGTPVQHAASALLELAPRLQSAIRDRLLGNLRYLSSRISASPACQLLHLEGGWYAVLRLPGVRGSEDWALELLAADDVHVHPGYLFDFASEAYLVLSLLTRSETFRSGVDRLLARVETTLAGLPARGAAGEEI